MISLPHYARRWILLYFLSSLAGAAGGLGAVLFRYMIELADQIFFGWLLLQMPWKIDTFDLGLILLPAVGGLIVGPVTMRAAPETSGAGIPEVMEAVAQRKSRLSKRTALLKIGVSAVTIGSGGSAGREGPIAQIGAVIGSFLGQLFKLSPQGSELLVVCGLSAGIAGTYNAPLGGALFGIEILLRRIDLSRAVPVFMASVVGAAIASSFLGRSPSIAFSGLRYWDPSELALYILLGLIFGLISVLWVKFFYAVNGLFDRIRIPRTLKPAVGGLFTGVLIMGFPEYGIGGVGYNGIDMALAGSFALSLLLTLGVLKLLATSLTIGSGGSGGIFAPTLYIGAMFGCALGLVFSFFFPVVAKDPFKYALPGMAALFAGATQAPINIMIMIPEMSRDFGLLPPIMASSVTSFFVAWLFLRGSSIYTVKLQRRGLDLRMGRSFTLDLVKVEEIMVKDPVEASPDMPVSALDELFEKYRLSGYPVVENGRLVGLAMLEDLEKIPGGERETVRISRLITEDKIATFPDESIGEALYKMDRNGLDMLPVSEREGSERLLGIVSKFSILQAYERYSESPFE